MFKTKRIRPIQEPAGQKQKRPPSPLHIPEVLEHIFSYIHTPNDMLSTLQVCREWYRMNRHLFVREAVVNYELEQQGLFKLSSQAYGALANLSTVGRLRWYDGFHIMHPRQPGWEQTLDKRMQALVNALQRKHEQYQKRQHQHHQRQQLQQKRQATARLFLDDNPLQHLDITAGMHFVAGFHKLLPFVGSLTRLSLKLDGNPGKVSLSEVFKSCPLLELVSIEALTSIVITGLDSPLTGAPLPLRSFSLYKTRLPQQDLDNLLSATPRLEELRLVSMLTDRSTTMQYSMTHLTRSLQERSIQLSTLHVQPTPSLHEITDTEMSKVMSDLDYTVTGWSFWAGDLTDRTLTSLKALHNVVTTLELHFDEETSTGPNSGLHRYLCESPHLLHLRAPRTAILVEAMDLHARGHILHRGYRGGANSWNKTVVNWNQFLSSVDFGQRQVWACRKLQTLHVSICSRTEAELLSPARSRIVFGYLSRICPVLQDLQIDTLQTSRNGSWVCPSLDLRLEGGSCLLTKMKQLRILKLGFGERAMAYQARDLNWLLVAGITAGDQKEKEIKQQRAMRKTIVEGWSTWLKAEQEDNAAWRASNACVSWAPESGTVEPGLEEVLKEMGLLLDVKKCLDEMDSLAMGGDESRWLPALRQVSFYSPARSALSPKMEFSRLFPPSRFEFTSPSLKR